MGEYIVEFGGQRFATQAESAQQVWDALRQEAGETGVIITSPGGREQFISPRYSSTDAEQIQRIREEGLTAPEASRVSIMEQQLADRPIASRAAAAIQGVPFAGEYVDEAAGAIFGPQAQAAMRLSQAAMAERRPVETLGLQLGTGIATTAPLAFAAAPARGAGLLSSMMRAGGTGAGFGAAEGLVSGYGSGQTPEERQLNAAQRAMLGGALGGVLGAAGPVAGAAFGRLGGMVPRRRARQAAQSVGLEPNAGDVAGDMLEMTRPPQTPTRPRSLAEVDQGSARALDTMVAMPNPAAGDVMGTLDAQAEQAYQGLTQLMDETMGRPLPLAIAQRQLMRDTADQREALYRAAYQSPIDYASDRGRELERALGTVDEEVIRDANRLMAREGLRSNQVRIEIADDGTMTFSSIPDVRQIDYITRALQNRASAALRAGSNEDFATLSGQVRRIRSTLDDLVDEYRVARSNAAEVIGQREAFDTGFDILGPMRRDEVMLAVEGLTAGELRNVRTGMREYIDQIMRRANQRNQSIDGYDETRAALNRLNNEEVFEKIRIVMGDAMADEAEALIDEIRAAVPSMAVRSQVAAGSQTAPRAMLAERISQVAGGDAASWPIERVRQATASLARAGVETPQERVQAAISGAAPLFARQMQPDEFTRVQQALRSIPAFQRQSTELLRSGIQAGGAGGVSMTPAMMRLMEQTGIAQGLGFGTPVRAGRR